MKKRLVLLAFASTIFTFTSCKKHHSKDMVEPTSKDDFLEEIHLCTDKTLPFSLREEGAVLKAKKWVNGQTIKIKFLNGDAFLQGKVKLYAAKWLPYANLKFQYVAANQAADIKIAFKWNNDGGSWSYMGIDCKGIAQTRPSMNFGWFTANTSATEFERVIVHEFGHALGMVHEHQSPKVAIPWDKPAVYAYYAGAPNYWNAAKVDANIFYKYSLASTNSTVFDRYSIMEYTVQESLTIGTYSIGSNTKLSAMDKTFIKGQYPF